ncbi:MAG TPA: LapA family protein [Candidatus Nanopelagicales bacterium]|jgi:uncharacterized integral membrane protein|nr:LapA family protein [Candidatus Nanopelagicales bacterium]
MAGDDSDGDRVGPDRLSDQQQQDVFGKPAMADGRRFIKPTLWGLLALFVVVFVVSNFQDVTVSFVAFQVQLKLFWVLVLCVALGALLAEGFRFWRRRRGEPERRSDGRT